MTCFYHFQQVVARIHATVCYPGPSIFSGNILRQRTTLRESIASRCLCHGPHNFEPRRNTSGNLSTLLKTSATSCFKSGKTNSLEELILSYFPMAEETLQREQLNTFISRRHSTISFHSGYNVMEIIIMTVS